MQFIKEWINDKKYYPYIFPVIIFILLISLSLLKINGSSSGSISQLLNPGAKDSSLIFGEPRQIRSDEWATGTPLVVSQKKLGFPETNSAVGDGQDMSVLIDVPTKSWDVLFKPQNLMFFILPFEMAFSFRWWFMLALLLLSSYLVLRLFLPPPNQNLKAALLSVALSMAPFIMWWYAGGTLLSIAYCLLIVFATFQLLKNDRTLIKIAFSLLVFYCLVSLAFTFYTPFIIASVFASVFVFLSLISKDGLKELKKLITKRNILLVLFSITMSLMVLVLFYIQHKQTISLILGTVYPGRRIVAEGPLRIRDSLNLFEQFFLQVSSFTKSNLINQSESSNFIYYSVYFLVVIIYFLYIDFKNKKPYWPLVILIAGASIIFFRLFAPFPTNWLFKIILMDSIPKTRLFIGLGIINIFIIAALVARINKEKSRLPSWLIISNLLLAFIILLYQFNIFSSKYSISSKYIYLIFALSVAILLIVYLITNKKTQMYGIILLALISFVFIFKINPIAIGLEYSKSSLVETISNINQEDPGTWAVLENLPLENYPTMAGVKNISGVMLYPQFNLWREFPNYENYEYIINRYAHVSFSLNQEGSDRMYLVAPDFYTVYVNPCSNFTQKNIKYFLSLKEIDLQCIEPVRSLDYYQAKAIIYKTIPLTKSKSTL
jgi:hypothetical protein